MPQSQMSDHGKVSENHTFHAVPVRIVWFMSGLANPDSAVEGPLVAGFQPFTISHSAIPISCTAIGKTAIRSIASVNSIKGESSAPRRKKTALT